MTDDTNDTQSDAQVDEDNSDSEQLQEHAIEEAQRIREDIDGGDEHYRTQRAIIDRERELSGFTVERKRTGHAIEDAKKRIEGLRELLKRVRNLDDETIVFETLPGGALAPVAPEDREAFENRTMEKVGNAQSKVESLEERVELIEQYTTVTKLAIEWLEGELEDLEDEVDTQDTAEESS